MSDTTTFNKTNLRFNVLKAVEAGELTMIRRVLVISVGAQRAVEKLEDLGHIVYETPAYKLTESGEELLASWREAA